MMRFGHSLADMPDVVVPALDREFTTDRLLAMSLSCGQADRDAGDLAAGGARWSNARADQGGTARAVRIWCDAH